MLSDDDFEEITFLSKKIQDNLYDLEAVERLYDIYKKSSDWYWDEEDDDFLISLIIELGTDKLTDSPIEKLFDEMYGSDSCEFKWISLIEETLIRMELGFNCWACKNIPEMFQMETSFKHLENTSSHSVKIDDLFEQNPRNNEFLQMMGYKGKVVLICDYCFEKAFPEHE